MATSHERHSEVATDSGQTDGKSAPLENKSAAPPAQANAITSKELDQPKTLAPAGALVPPASKSGNVGTTPASAGRSRFLRTTRGRLLAAGIVLAVGLGAYFLVPWLITALTTVSTDDAYVNSHVTFVAPRVAGQVQEVFVDDNDPVEKGQLLVLLDEEPFQKQVDIKYAAVVAAKTDLVAAKAQVRGLEALLRSQRWSLQYAMEQVANQIANLNANVATLKSQHAKLELAKENLKRAEQLWKDKSIAKEELDEKRANAKTADAAVEQALQIVHATRVSLGLPAEPSKGKPLTDVPRDLDQNFSKVRTALAELVKTSAQLGLPLANTMATPTQVIEEFKKRNTKGDIDKILEDLVQDAPAVKQAEAKLLQARSDLAQAELNLSYCRVVSEIDGVVTRRNVNRGNNVQVGQSLMAVRSVTEIWIDANFKETQLADLCIGQRVKIEVDMYGSRHELDGHITGFTMGTGSTLALLPPQNATGNFVKVVQRLPVKIELDNYDPKNVPLFVGLSVTPYVYYREAPTGPNAGKKLQLNAPKGSASP
jgi:membrane fusion protein (multidrug efflux system)